MKTKTLLTSLILCSISLWAVAQPKNLKVNWDTPKLAVSLPYSADTGYEEEEFGTLYVFSEDFPLAMSAIASINDVKLTPTSYKEVFAQSTNGKDIKGVMLDNGIYLITFHWDDPTDPRCAFIYMVNDKLYVTGEIQSDNGKWAEHLNKISFTKK